MMYLSTTNKNETIKSNELVEIINQFRMMEGKETALSHKNFIAKIRKELDTLESLGLRGELNFKQTYYLDSQGKKQPCYELTRDGMLQIN